MVRQFRLCDSRIEECPADALRLAAKRVAPGVTTEELNALVDAYIRSRGATASFKGYNGYPASICASVNEEVVHGIPGKKVLKEGDIVSVDVGAIYKGYHGDAAITIPVGHIGPEVQRLLEATKGAASRRRSRCPH